MRDIDQKTKSLNRDAEDAQAEVDQEHEELKSTLTEGMTAALENEIEASSANLKRIDKYILRVANCARSTFCNFY